MNLELIKQKLRDHRKLVLSLGASALIVIGLVFGYFRGTDESAIVTATKGSIEEEVLVTGNTRAESEVNLGFEISGKVAQVNASIGSRVRVGQRLVALDQAGALADLSKAKASLNQALVELNSKRQSSPESYESIYQTHASNIREAFVKADDAVRNDVDTFFTNPRDFNAEFDPVINDGNTSFFNGIPDSTRFKISSDRVSIEKLLTDWEKSQTLPGAEGDIAQAFNLARTNLLTIAAFLDSIASAINSIESTTFQFDATIKGYKDSISRARDKINTAYSDILESKENLNNAPTKTGGDFDDVLAEEANVESLKADVSSKEADLSKTVIYSPISGVVTKLEAEKGEIMSAGSTVISVISDKNLQVETNVSEVNIGKVSVGNKVNITFDAFKGETYSGKVFYIDPGDTIIDGVPTYKIYVSFTDDVESKIKSGLTANISIITQSKTDVVKIPVYAVEREGTESFVTLKHSDGAKERRPVVLGLVGKDGEVEVISGLSEGDEIIVNIE